MNYYPYSDRKSRRSHKNSRDGCSNCKTRRIKCTEELPECMNCIKKNLNCAYLEYTAEQLEPIRLKNEKKRRELEAIRQINDKIIVEGSSTQSGGRQNVQDPSTGSISAYSRSSSASSAPLYSRTSSNESFQYTTQDTIQKIPPTFDPQSRNNSSSQINVQSIYQRSEIRKFPSDSDILKVPPTPVIPEYPHFRSTSTTDMSSELQHQSNIFQKFHTSSSDNMIQSKRLSEVGNANLFGGLTQNMEGQARNYQLCVQFSSQSPFEKMLPSSKLNPVRINLLNKKVNAGDISSIPIKTTSSSFENSFNKDYHYTSMGKMIEESYESILYFNCFMINTMDYMIYMACNAAKENQYVHSQKDPQANLKSSNLVVDEKLINVLESKSIKYYGALISTLRSSVIGDSRERPIRTSLFIAWNSLIHRDSSMDSLLIFVTGCSNLIYQSLSSGEYDKSSNLGHIFDTINGNLNTTFFLKFRPNFSLLAEYESFLSRFMKIIDKFISFQSDNVEYLKIKYNLIQLYEFTSKLNSHYIPEIIKTNRLSNEMHAFTACDATEKLFYLDPKIAFQILQNWFKILPPILNTNMNTNPNYKIFKLFYESLMRLLSSTFPYFKSILVHDFTKSFKYFEEFNFKEFNFDFDSFKELFDLDDHSKFPAAKFPLTEIKIITNYNLRMINFLNNRAKLLFLYNDLYEIHKLLLTKSDNQFLLKHNNRKSNSSTSGNITHGNVDPNKTMVFLIDNKLGIIENQMTNFGNNLIKFENYPILESINQTIYKSCKEEQNVSVPANISSVESVEDNNYHILNEELNGRILLNFDYDKGICKNDTDITKVIRNLSNVTSHGSSQNINLEDRKRIIRIFYDTRTEIMRCISE